MEGFQGSDLDLVTLLPPTFYGLELSYVTTAAWETGNEIQLCAQRAGKWPDEFAKDSTRAIIPTSHLYLPLIRASPCSKHFITIDPFNPPSNSVS